MNWHCYVWEVLDKTMVVVSELDEWLDFLYFGRSWPGYNGLKLLRISLDTFIADNVVKEFHFLLVKFIVGNFVNKLVIDE